MAGTIVGPLSQLTSKKHLQFLFLRTTVGLSQGLAKQQVFHFTTLSRSMKEKDARKMIQGLIGVAIISTWCIALSLQLPEMSPVVSNEINVTNSISTSFAVKDFPNKPFFVLHVGPPKTATTTIQCGLDALSLDLAKEDSYYFVGKRCPHSSGSMRNGEAGIPGHHLMMGLIGANPNSRGFEKLKDRMEYHRSHGNHMIFSIEAMSNHLTDRPETWALFLSLFEGWKVRIVVAYRHYFDWIRSMYFQQHIGKKYRHLWPHQSGLAHPSFQQFLNNHLDRWEKREPSNDGHSWGQHLSLYALQYFHKHFEDVQVFDLHQEGDVLTNFICQMIPGASNICHRLQKESSKEANVKRESHSFDADRIAMAAYQGGMINGTIARHVVVRKIADYLQTTMDLLDSSNVVCLPNDMKARLLNASLWFEREVAISKPDGGEPQDVFHRNVSDHTALFHKTVEGMKFCEVNTESLLKLEHWKKFMAKMEPSKKR